MTEAETPGAPDLPRKEHEICSYTIDEPRQVDLLCTCGSVFEAYTLASAVSRWADHRAAAEARAVLATSGGE